MVNQKKHTVFVGSYQRNKDIEQAAHIISGKLPGQKLVCAQVFGVFGIWLNGADPLAIRWANDVKKDKKQRIFSSMLFSPHFFPYVHKDQVSKGLGRWFKNTRDSRLIRTFQNRIGSLFHIRVPIHPSYLSLIPESMVSFDRKTYIMHNLDPYGHPLARVIRKVNAQGDFFVAISSLNAHGQKEIVDFQAAYDYCQESGKVAMILTDHTYKRPEIKGSFATVDIRNSEILDHDRRFGGGIVRDGWIDPRVLENLLGIILNKDSMAEAKYSKSDVISRLSSLSLTPYQIRQFIFRYIRGESEDTILDRMRCRGVVLKK